MSRFYTSVIPYGNDLLVRGVEGKDRFTDKVPYAPTLFHKYKDKTRYRSLSDQYLIPKKLPSIRKARELIERYKDHKDFLFGNERFHFQYISEYYPNDIDWVKEHIKVYTIDIEVTAEQGFPNAEEAIEQLICISLKDHANKKMLVWGIGEFKNTRDYVQYIRCDTEKDLIKEFLKFWIQSPPDIITGWNSKFFDLYYLHNRIRNVFDERTAKKLSPWNIVQEEEVYTMGRVHKYVKPLGIAQLDYLDLYKKFTASNQESYKLDHIAEVELGEKKDDNPYDTFKEWYTKDYQTFVDYNIQDVELVDKLEDRLSLIELVITMAYNAKVNYEDVYSQVRMWDNIIYNFLKKQNLVCPLRPGTQSKDDLVGAYVKDPQVGLHNWVVSFDLNSLYPHLIMQYNISPETKMPEKQQVTVKGLIEKRYDTGNLKLLNKTMAANGTIYRTDVQGFLPKIIQKEYNDRVGYKKKMLEAQQQYENTKDKKYDKLARRYHLIQFSKKISLNSAYGAIGNRYFRYFDFDEAQAITTSGQLAIRWIEEKVNQYFNKMLNNKKDYVIASDTDSIYVSFDDMVKKLPEGTPKEKIVKVLDKFCEEKLEPFMSKSYKELADYVNAYEQKMFMKREVIADKGIWTAKKRYILNVHNSEGVQYAKPKLKMMGIEAVKSSTPKVCRGKIKEALEIIMTKDENALKDFYKKFKLQFTNMSPEEIGFPRSVNNLSKYSDPNGIYKKSTPMHVKGALVYNHLLRLKKITHLFPLILEGDKIKYLHILTPNSYQAKVISFPAKLPKQFGLHKLIDYETQYNKSFVEPMSFILDSAKWSVDASGDNTIEEFFA